MKKEILKNWKVYLSGPIESMKDDGVGWRQRFTDVVREKGLGLELTDPTNKNDSVVLEIGAAREQLRALKKNREFEEVTFIMERVRRWDLRAVDLAHIIVVNIDDDIPTVGTVDEVVRASNQDKPILAIVDGGPEKCPDWYFPYIKYTEMFHTVEDLVEHLVRIHEGKMGIDSRWIRVESIK